MPPRKSQKSSLKVPVTASPAEMPQRRKSKRVSFSMELANVRNISPSDAHPTDRETPDQTVIISQAKDADESSLGSFVQDDQSLHLNLNKGSTPASSPNLLISLTDIAEDKKAAYSMSMVNEDDLVGRISHGLDGGNKTRRSNHDMDISGTNLDSRPAGRNLIDETDFHHTEMLIDTHKPDPALSNPDGSFGVVTKVLSDARSKASVTALLDPTAQLSLNQLRLSATPGKTPVQQSQSKIRTRAQTSGSPIKTPAQKSQRRTETPAQSSLRQTATPAAATRSWVKISAQTSKSRLSTPSSTADVTQPGTSTGVELTSVMNEESLSTSPREKRKRKNEGETEAEFKRRTRSFLQSSHVVAPETSSVKPWILDEMPTITMDTTTITDFSKSQCQFDDEAEAAQLAHQAKCDELRKEIERLNKEEKELQREFEEKEVEKQKEMNESVKKNSSLLQIGFLEKLTLWDWYPVEDSGYKQHLFKYPVGKPKPLAALSYTVDVDPINRFVVTNISDFEIEKLNLHKLHSIHYITNQLTQACEEEKVKGQYVGMPSLPLFLWRVTRLVEQAGNLLKDLLQSTNDQRKVFVYSEDNKLYMKLVGKRWLAAIQIKGAHITSYPNQKLSFTLESEKGFGEIPTALTSYFTKEKIITEQEGQTYLPRLSTLFTNSIRE